MNSALAAEGCLTLKAGSFPAACLAMGKVNLLPVESWSSAPIIGKPAHEKGLLALLAHFFLANHPRWNPGDEN
jgi:hypothetical protein